jgi:hypothetical protein
MDSFQEWRTRRVKTSSSQKIGKDENTDGNCRKGGGRVAGSHRITQDVASWRQAGFPCCFQHLADDPQATTPRVLSLLTSGPHKQIAAFAKRHLNRFPILCRLKNSLLPGGKIGFVSVGNFAERCCGIAGQTGKGSLA